MRDLTRDFTWSFFIAGITIFLAGAISLPVRRIKTWEERRAAANADPEQFPPFPSNASNANGDVMTGEGTGSEAPRKSGKMGSTGIKFGGNSYSRLAQEDETAETSAADVNEENEEQGEEGEAIDDEAMFPTEEDEEQEEEAISQIDEQEEVDIEAQTT